MVEIVKGLIPEDAIWEDGWRKFKIGEYLRGLQPSLELFFRKQAYAYNGSFGMAMSHPNVDNLNDWNDPEVWLCATGWGDDGWRYAMNGARKGRIALRTEHDSLTICRRPSDEHPIVDEVKSKEDDGSLLWGDFAHPGAVWVKAYGYEFVVGTSGLKGIEDDVVAHMIGRPLALAMRRVEDPDYPN